jgi:hypothetical protein
VLSLSGTLSKFCIQFQKRSNPIRPKLKQIGNVSGPVVQVLKPRTIFQEGQPELAVLAQRAKITKARYDISTL